MSAWLDQIWDAVERNGIARRNMTTLKQYAGDWFMDGVAEIKYEARRRKYHVVKMGEQIVVFKHANEVLC